MWFQLWSDMRAAEMAREQTREAERHAAIELRQEALDEERRIRALVVALDHAIHQWAKYSDANPHCRNVKLDKELTEASKAILKGLR